MLGYSFKFISAWVEPNEMPPGGNIAAPLNTGNVGQSKVGGLILNLGGAAYGLIVQEGNSGFGLDNPSEKVEVNGNIKLKGKVMGLEEPQEANDAATKNYVDSQVGSNPSSWECKTVSGTQIAECPSGFSLITGGCDCSAGNGCDVSKPSSNGWVCSPNSTVYARCCK